jgi:hypothetical protein
LGLPFFQRELGPAMKEQAQTIADIFWETKISSNQKSCGISNESKLFEVLRDL